MKDTTFYTFAGIIICTLFFQAPIVADCGMDHEKPDEVQVDTQLHKSEITGIYNYTRIGTGTGFGGATEPSAMKALKAEGYQSVINLRLANEKGAEVPASRMAASQSGLEYIHLPFDSGNPGPDFFEQFLAAVDDPSNQPVYVHCGSATRAAALWMSKRVIDDGWTVEAAAEEARGIAGKPDAAVAFARKYIEAQQQ